MHATAICALPPILLGAATTLEWMEAGIDSCPAEDCRAMAPRGIQSILDVALAASRASRPEAYQCGTAPTHLPHGRREPDVGAPRIHGELTMLCFEVSERTVLRWMRKAPRNPEPAKRWAAFLSNHREAIAAMDFFTIPTLTFGVLRFTRQVCLPLAGSDSSGTSLDSEPKTAPVAQEPSRFEV
jgi:hypothetical protein